MANMDITSQFAQHAKTILEQSPDLYLILSPQLIVVGATNNYLKATMVKREDIIGRYLFDIFPDNPNDKSATGSRNLKHSLDRVLAEKTCDAMAIQKYDIKNPSTASNDFEEHYWSPLNCPIVNEHNEVMYILHRVEDVTEYIRLQETHDSQLQIMESLQSSRDKVGNEVLRRAQDIQKLNRKLQESTHFNAAFLAAIPDTVILANQEGLIEFVNNQAVVMFGYTKEEFLGQPVEMLMPEDVAVIHPHHRENYIKTPRVRPMGQGMELKGRRKNGEIFPVEISLSPLQTTRGLAAIAVIRDVTHQTTQKRLLEQKESALRSLYNAVEKEKADLQLTHHDKIITTKLNETLLICKEIKELVQYLYKNE